MGSKFKRKHLIIIVTSGIFAIALTALFVIIAWQENAKNATFNTAAKLYAAGKFPEAQKNLLAALKNDQTNEAAWVMLAKIYERDIFFRNAAAAWGIAHQLNLLDDQYRQRQLQAQYQGRMFYELATTMQESEKQDYPSIYAFALAISSQRPDELKKLVVLLPPELESTKFIKMLTTPPVTPDKLQPFTQSQDKTIKVEALLTLAYLQQSANKSDLAEQNFLRAAAINPEAVNCLLGDFYFSQKKYDKAAEIYKICDTMFLPENSAIHYAESLFILNDLEELQHLAGNFSANRHQDFRITAYFNALIGYLQNDMEKLGFALKAMSDLNAGFAPMLIYRHSLNTGNINELTVTLRRSPEILSDNAAAEEIYTQINPVLIAAYQAKRSADVAPLAKIFTERLPNKLLPWQIIMLNALDKNLLDTTELDSALKFFPDEPTFNYLKVNTLISQNRYEEAEKYFIKLKSAAGLFPDLPLLEVTILEGRGKIAECAAKLRDALKTRPLDQSLNRRALAFGYRHPEQNLLPQLRESSQSGQLAAFLLNGQSNKRDELANALKNNYFLDNLDAAKPNDRELIYIIALICAENDFIPEAIKFYEKLLPHLHDKTLIQLNLSELYAAAKQPAPALKMAKSAYLNHSRTPAIIICYGLRLADARQNAAALEILTPFADNSRVKERYRQILENGVMEEYDQKAYASSQKWLNKLREKYPESTVLAEYQTKLNAVQQK